MFRYWVVHASLDVFSVIQNRPWMSSNSVFHKFLTKVTARKQRFIIWLAEPSMTCTNFLLLHREPTRIISSLFFLTNFLVFATLEIHDPILLKLYWLYIIQQWYLNISIFLSLKWTLTFHTEVHLSTNFILHVMILLFFLNNVSSLEVSYPQHLLKKEWLKLLLQ